MTKEEIFAIMNQNPAFFLATVEGDQPRVRGMLLYKADESGIVFHTGTMKDVYAQIVANPKAELCFNNKTGLQVRVRGTLTCIEDTKIKDEISEHPSRVFLKQWKESGEMSDFYRTFAVFSMKDGVAVTWSIDRNFAPKEDIQL